MIFRSHFDLYAPVSKFDVLEMGTTYGSENPELLRCQIAKICSVQLHVFES